MVRVPRKPDERVGKAKELYDKGVRLVEIAGRLGIPEGTVRRWKSTYGWDSERSDKIPNVRNGKKAGDARGEEAGGQAAHGQCGTEGLTGKQAAFCLHYANSCNATSSYQKAYGCSRETAMAAGSRMLRNVKVRNEVERLKKERLETAMFGERDIFQWHLDIATASITDYVSFGREEAPVVSKDGPVLDEKGKPVTKEVNYVKFRDSGEVDGLVIHKVRLVKDGASIELYDAFRSMEWLERNLGLGTDSQRSMASQVLMAYRKRVEDADGRG